MSLHLNNIHLINNNINLIKKNVVERYVWNASWEVVKRHIAQTKKKYLLKTGVNLNALFAPFNMRLMQISRPRFKQSKNSNCMLNTWIYVIGCFVNFLVIFGYIWVEIVFLKGLVRFREIRKIEDLMKFKN